MSTKKLNKKWDSIQKFEFSKPNSPEILWDQFRAGLALALHSLEDEDFLIIESKDDKNDEKGYVQFAGFDQDGIRAEVSSEQFCQFPLGKKKSRKILHRLGWYDPTYILSADLY